MLVAAHKGYTRAVQCLVANGASIEKSDDFHVILSTTGESRARAYVAPANDGGIHLELADSVLLKAAASMTGR